jgi:DNA ligase (NAD+)
MDINGADEQLIALLVAHGLVHDVAEFYRLKLKELAALPGMASDAGQKFFDAIMSSKQRDAWRLLYGLNIPLVGVGEAQSLAKGFSTVDAVFAAGAARLTGEGGVNEAVAQNIVRWYADSVNRKLVRRLEKFGLNFKSEL